MKLFRDLDLRKPIARACVATIGNFDGIHRGHQSLIDRVKDEASDRDLGAVLVTFEPMAREYFAPLGSPGRIYNASQRIRELSRQHLDAVWLMRFNRSLAELSADDFVQYLIKGINPRVIVVGEGFRFGKDRAGTVESLAAGGAVEVIAMPAVRIDGERVSSTLIRERLASGNMAGAARLLGRPFTMYGRVVRGQQLGRKLGFPTANIRLHRRTTPINGIFAVRVTGGGLTGQAGVASIGTRPTVGGKETLLEVHVFDFGGDLYGTHLDVTFVAKLRDEEKFDDLDAMTVQMHEDARQARKLLAA